jgi:hypothetical protein
VGGQSERVVEEPADHLRGDLTMNSGSWASYQSALPIEARGGEPDDDAPAPGRHDNEPPDCVVVEWFQPFEHEEVWSEYEPATESYRDVAVRTGYSAPVGRWFPAESWAWKHATAWRDAMARRWGHATIEAVF